jgi:hypothetical protein
MMVKFSVSEVIERARAARNRADRALQVARTKAEKQRAKAQREKAVKTLNEAQSIKKKIRKLDSEKKRARTEITARKREKEIDELRREASTKGRIVVGLKGKINKGIDETLKKWGL